MISEIEAGNVETLIVKDMSRLGRNYLQVGFLYGNPISAEKSPLPRNQQQHRQQQGFRQRLCSILEHYE